MKFSELWLREWVNPAIDSDALANQITMAGLEVDGVEPVAGSFHGVVVGEVVECAHFRKRSAFRTRYSGTVGHSSGSDVSRCDLR